MPTLVAYFTTIKTSSHRVEIETENTEVTEEDIDRAWDQAHEDYLGDYELLDFDSYSEVDCCIENT